MKRLFLQFIQFYPKGTLCIMLIIIGNGIGSLNSNEAVCVSLCINALFFPTYGEIVGQAGFFSTI